MDPFGSVSHGVAEEEGTGVSHLEAGADTVLCVYGPSHSLVDFALLIFWHPFRPERLSNFLFPGLVRRLLGDRRSRRFQRFDGAKNKQNKTRELLH